MYSWGSSGSGDHTAPQGWDVKSIRFPSVCWRPLHIPSVFLVSEHRFLVMGHLRATSCLLLLCDHLVHPWAICHLMNRTDFRELVCTQCYRALPCHPHHPLEFLQQLPCRTLYHRLNSNSWEKQEFTIFFFFQITGLAEFLCLNILKILLAGLLI